MLPTVIFGGIFEFLHLAYIIFTLFFLCLSYVNALSLILPSSSSCARTQLPAPHRYCLFPANPDYFRPPSFFITVFFYRSSFFFPYALFFLLFFVLSLFFLPSLLLFSEFWFFLSFLFSAFCFFLTHGFIHSLFSVFWFVVIDLYVYLKIILIMSLFKILGDLLSFSIYTCVLLIFLACM